MDIDNSKNNFIYYPLIIQLQFHLMIITKEWDKGGGGSIKSFYKCPQYLDIKVEILLGTKSYQLTDSFEGSHQREKLETKLHFIKKKFPT